MKVLMFDAVLEKNDGSVTICPPMCFDSPQEAFLLIMESARQESLKLKQMFCLGLYDVSCHVVEQFVAAGQVYDCDYDDKTNNEMMSFVHDNFYAESEVNVDA